MYDKLLSMTWDEMYNSEYSFKSNTEIHVIDIRGSELQNGDDSLILIYYNTFSGLPMVIFQRYVGSIDIDLPSTYKDFIVYVDKCEYEGLEFTEVTFVREEIVKALD